MSEETKPLKWSRALPYCKRCGSVQPKHECVMECCVCGRESFTINLSLREDRFYCWDHIEEAGAALRKETTTEEITATTNNQLELLAKGES